MFRMLARLSAVVAVGLLALPGAALADGNRQFTHEDSGGREPLATYQVTEVVPFDDTEILTLDEIIFLEQNGIDLGLAEYAGGRSLRPEALSPEMILFFEVNGIYTSVASYAVSDNIPTGEHPDDWPVGLNR